MTESLVSTQGVFRVWRRYYQVFRQNLLYGMVTTFVEPLLFLIAFGYGLGALIPQIETGGQTLGYREYIMAGILAQTVMIQGFFDAAYGSFIRMYYQRIFKSIATTPITLSEVLWGELAWDVTKSTFAASAVLLLGVVVGDFSLPRALLALPLCIAGALLFSALGLWMAAISKNIEALTYPQHLLVFPMFLFCGVYYPVETLPSVVQAVTWLLPLTALTSLIRSLLLDTQFQPLAVVNLLFWLVGLVWISRRAMTRRLVR